MISSVSLTPPLVTTPIAPLLFQLRMLFEPIDPTRKNGLNLFQSIVVSLFEAVLLSVD
jgi:hypothetical protein